MLSFRKEFFKKNITFINASVPGPQLGTIYNISYFVNELPNDGKKRVLIIALDPTFFTIDHGKKGMEKDELQEGSLLRKLIRIPGINLRLIYRDNLGYFFSLNELKEKIKGKKDISFSALAYQNGYRVDGSFRDMVSLRNPPNQNGITAIQIHKKIEEFEKSSSHEYFENDTTKIVKNNLQHLSDLLDLCKQKNITVIGLIPPSPTLVAQVFYSTSTTFGEKNRQLRKDEMELFTRHGFKAYDLSDINLYGASNFEFFDALHGTDLLFARVGLYLAVNKKDPTLAPLLDTKALREMIKKSKGGFLSF
jgi:hypothetical protein